MSSWTNITLEPKEVTETELPSKGEVDKLSELAGRVYGSVLEGSSHSTESALHDLINEAEELEEKTREVSGEERVQEYMEERWSDDSEDSFGILHRSPPTFQYAEGSLGWNSRVESVVEEIFDDCSYVERVLIICADDTGDTGTGWLYARGEDGATQVDKKSGAERARGFDVVDYFEKEYGISGEPRGAW